MGEVIEFKPKEQEPGFAHLHCPVCDGAIFRVLYSNGSPHFVCIDCHSMFPKWPHEREPA